MEIKQNKNFGVTSTDIREVNNTEMRQMTELKKRIEDVLNSHKPESKEKKYISDADLNLVRAILSVFTKDFEEKTSSAFDEFLKNEENSSDKNQQKSVESVEESSQIIPGMI